MIPSVEVVIGEETPYFPIVVTLDPGDQYALEITFDPGKWDLPWSASVIRTRRLHMRAVYQIGPTEDAGKRGVWTGKVASRYGDYTLRDNRR
jgi:hypothetical protein